MAESFSRFAEVFTAVCFLLIAAFAVVIGLLTPWGAEYSAALLIFGASALAVVAVIYGKLRPRISDRTAFIILLLLCIAVKGGFAALVQVEPEADAYTFYTAAAQLAEGKVGDYIPHYLAMFPHIFGYSWFLSLFIRVFGASYTLPSVINVLLSTISMLCIYSLLRRRATVRAAEFGAFLWILCPSQTIYNVLIFADPYYTILLLIALCMWDRGMSADTRPKKLVFAALTGLALTLCETARPVGAIMLIALVLLSVFFMTGKGRGERVALLVLCAAVFFGGKAANAALFERAMGLEPGSTVGYTVYVGLNKSSSGTWNAEDSLHFEAVVAETEPFSADKAGDVLMEDAKERFASLGVGGFLRLIPYKLRILICTDNVCTFYAQRGLAYLTQLRSLCNAFWYLLWLLAAAGAFFSARRAGRRVETPPLLWAVLMYTVGVTAAHMLTEVAPRYHYSLVPMLILAAAWGSDLARLRLSVQTEDLPSL